MRAFPVFLHLQISYKFSNLLLLLRITMNLLFFGEFPLNILPAFGYYVCSVNFYRYKFFINCINIPPAMAQNMIHMKRNEFNFAPHRV